MILYSHLISYPTPSNLSYFWGFGSMAGIVLVIQIFSGLLLSMHYIPEVTFAYNSVEHIMRDVPYGYIIRYTHSSGASILFIVVYAHLLRNIFYRCFTRVFLWYSGLVLLLLIMATAFFGYVLPWGMMSFWGATVITNLFGAIPFVGDYITQWLWGGYSIDGPTLRKFYSLHFLLPFIIIGLSCVHLVLLHDGGSTNPLGVCGDIDVIRFYPAYWLKDLHGMVGVLGPLYIYLVFFEPNLLMHPDNYIKANPLVTPRHIVPEWYFLPLYAILRAIPSKGGGVFCMFFAIIVLFLLPFIAPFRVVLSKYSTLWLFCFWTFISDVCLLGALGARVVKQPYIIMSQFCTFYYFLYFLVIIPLFVFVETP